MTEVKSPSNNEIDLIELSARIGRGIRKFFMSLIDIMLFLFVFGIRKSVWLIIIVIAGATVGYFAFKSSERVYSSEMIAQPNGFTSIDMVQYINDIHEMCEKRNYLGIANAFEISEDDANKILNIEAYNFIDVNNDGIGDHVDYKYQFNALDTTKSIILSRILIRAEVLDNMAFTEVKEGLIRYIEKNPYLLTVNAHRKEELKALIWQTEKEINTLDSLQGYEYYRSLEGRNSRSDGQIVVMNEKVTQLYYRDKVSLLNSKLEYEKALKLASDPITVIKNFSALQIEDNPASSYIIKYGVYSGILGYIFLIVMLFWRRIQSFLVTKG